MDKEQIEKVMNKFFDTLDPDRRERPYGNMGPRARASLAEQIAAVLPPTVDALVGVLGEYKRQNPNAFSIGLFADGSGSVRDLNFITVGPRWPPRDNPGETIIEALKDAMPPEPTENEKCTGRASVYCLSC